MCLCVKERDILEMVLPWQQRLLALQGPGTTGGRAQLGEKQRKIL